MSYIAIFFACLIAVSTVSCADDETDTIARRITESVLQECNMDESCLKEYSKQLGETLEHSRRQLERTEHVLKEAEEALSKPGTPTWQETPEVPLQSGSEIYREIIGKDPY